MWYIRSSPPHRCVNSQITRIMWFIAAFPALKGCLVQSWRIYPAAIMPVGRKGNCPTDPRGLGAVLCHRNKTAKLFTKHHPVFWWVKCSLVMIDGGPALFPTPACGHLLIIHLRKLWIKISILKTCVFQGRRPSMSKEIFTPVWSTENNPQIPCTGRCLREASSFRWVQREHTLLSSLFLSFWRNWGGEVKFQGMIIWREQK